MVYSHSPSPRSNKCRTRTLTITLQINEATLCKLQEPHTPQIINTMSKMTRSAEATSSMLHKKCAELRLVLETLLRRDGGFDVLVQCVIVLCRCSCSCTHSVSNGRERGCCRARRTVAAGCLVRSVVHHVPSLIPLGRSCIHIRHSGRGRGCCGGLAPLLLLLLLLFTTTVPCFKEVVARLSCTQ